MSFLPAVYNFPKKKYYHLWEEKQLECFRVQLTY